MIRERVPNFLEARGEIIIVPLFLFFWNRLLRSRWLESAGRMAFSGKGTTHRGHLGFYRVETGVHLPGALSQITIPLGNADDFSEGQ